MGRNFLAKTDSRQITRGFLEDEDRVSLGLPTSSVFLCMCVRSAGEVWVWFSRASRRE